MGLDWAMDTWLPGTPLCLLPLPSLEVAIQKSTVVAPSAFGCHVTHQDQGKFLAKFRIRQDLWPGASSKVLFKKLFFELNWHHVISPFKLSPFFFLVWAPGIFFSAFPRTSWIFIFAVHFNLAKHLGISTLSSQGGIEIGVVEEINKNKA